MFHFKMDQEGKQRPENDHRAQHHQFLNVPDDHGFQDLGGHFKFQTQGKAVGQLEFNIAGDPQSQTSGIAPESGAGGYGDDGNAHQFAQGDQDL